MFHFLLHVFCSKHAAACFIFYCCPIAASNFMRFLKKHVVNNETCSSRTIVWGIAWTCLVDKTNYSTKTQLLLTNLWQGHWSLWPSSAFYFTHFTYFTTCSCCCTLLTLLHAPAVALYLLYYMLLSCTYLLYYVLLLLHINYFTKCRVPRVSGLCRLWWWIRWDFMYLT